VLYLYKMWQMGLMAFSVENRPINQPPQSTLNVCFFRKRTFKPPEYQDSDRLLSAISGLSEYDINSPDDDMTSRAPHRGESASIWSSWGPIFPAEKIEKNGNVASNSRNCVIRNCQKLTVLRSVHRYLGHLNVRFPPETGH